MGAGPPRSLHGIDFERFSQWRTQADRETLARRARILLVAVIATTGAATGMGAVLVSAAIQGPEHVRIGASAYIAAVVGAAAFGTYVLRGGYAHRRSWQGRKLARRSRPAPERVQERADILALAVGLTGNEVSVIPGAGVNAATFGRPDAARTVLTEGACRLHTAHLDAVLAYCVVQLADRHLRAVRDSLTAVALYANLTKLLWSMVIVGYVAGELASGKGPWVEITALGTLGIIVVVACGTLATFAAIGLAHAADSLADSDAIACTFRPDVYAHLLMSMARDTHKTDSDVSPLLWMERDTERRNLASIVGCFHGQYEIEARAERMCGVAGSDALTEWRPGD